MASEHYKKTATKNSYLRLNRYDSVFYCRHCHEQSDIVIGMMWKDGKPVEHTRDADILCPQCLNLSKSDEIIDASGKEITNIYSHLSYFDNGDTVRAYIFSKEISFFSKKLQQKHIKTMVVFNIKTGQTYFFEPRYENTSKRWKHYGGPRLKNISISSYAGLLMSFKLNEQDPKVQGLMDLLHAKLQEKFPYPVKSLQSYGQEHNRTKPYGEKRLSLAIMANYVRLPHLNSYDFNQFIEDNRHLYEDKKFAYIMRKARPDTSNPIGDLVKAFKGPDVKSIRKLVMKNLDYLSRLFMFQDFKDVNNVRRLLEKTDEWRRGYSLYDVKISPFIKAMLKKAPETVVANKILKDNSIHWLTDAARMYFDIKEINEDYDFDISRSLRDLHDIFSMDYDKLQHPNLPLEYSERELKIECDIDGYEFRLAKETHELITVGAKMDICVGSYGGRAHRKDLAICVAYKDNEPVICFELSRHLDRVLQAKLYKNQRPKDELYDLCMEFINRNEMKIDTWDLQKPEEYPEAI